MVFAGFRKFYRGGSILHRPAHAVRHDIGRVHDHKRLLVDHPAAFFLKGFRFDEDMVLRQGG
jgi:hypothetical protein